MKYAIGVVFVALVLAVGWFFVMPALSANALQTALKTSDVITINQTVDFPALRENLRGSLSMALSQQNNSSDPGALLGAALAGSFLNLLLDQLVTPAGLSALFSGGLGSLSGGPARSLQVSSGLLGLDRYGITLTDSSDSQNKIVLLLMPRGLQWKLVGITFSPAALGR